MNDRITPLASAVRTPRFLSAAALLALLFTVLLAPSAVAQTNVMASDGLFETHTEIGWTLETTGSELIKIERDGTMITILASDARGYLDTGGDPGTAYTYCVIVNTDGVDGTPVCDAGSRVVLPPDGAEATDQLDASRVVFTWNDRSLVESQYEVKRDDVVVATLPANTTEYADTTAVPEVPYFYCVTAIDGDGFRSQPACDQGTRATITPPANVAATDGLAPNYVRITWTDQSATEDNYLLWRDGTYIGDPIPANTTSVDDLTAVPGTDHLYCVVSSENNNTSVLVCDSGRAGGLGVPEDVAVSLDTFDDRVQLTWRDGEDQEDGFVVERDGTPLDTLGVEARTFNDFTALQGTTYTYCLTAFSEFDENALSKSTPVCANGRRSNVLPPENVAATEDEFEDRVRITWDNPSTTASLLAVYRVTPATTDTVLIRTVLPNVVSYDDVIIASDQDYTYCVAAFTVPGATATVEADVVEALVRQVGVEVPGVAMAQEATITAAEFRVLANNAVQLARISANFAESARVCDVGRRSLTPPDGVSATFDDAETHVVVTWADASEVERGHRVYRQAQNQEPELVEEVVGSRTSLEDYRGVPGVTYTYQVRTFDAMGESMPDTDTGRRTLKAPTAVQATDGTNETEVTITWMDNSRAETGYVITEDATPVDTVGASVTSYTATGLTDGGATHAYGVQALDSLGTSALVEDEGGPGLFAPQDLNASDAYPDRVVLVWVDASAIEDNYRIYRDGMTLATIAADSTTYTDMSPTGLHTYCVEALNEAGGMTFASDQTCDAGQVGMIVVQDQGSSVSRNRLFDPDPDTLGLGHNFYPVDIDAGRIVVGSSGARNGVDDFYGEDHPFGAAYIYEQSEQGVGSWDLQTILEGPGAYSTFGADVAISGDYVLIGVPGNEGATGISKASSSSSPCQSGINRAPRLYHRNQGGMDNWGLAQSLSPDGPLLGCYGFAVDLDGDYAVVGNKFDLVDVFERGAGDAWSFVQRIEEPATLPFYFGQAIALSGDLLGIAYYDLNISPEIYVADLYERDAMGTWNQIARLKALEDPTRSAPSIDIDEEAGLVVVRARNKVYGFEYDAEENTWGTDCFDATCDPSFIVEAEDGISFGVGTVRTAAGQIVVGAPFDNEVGSNVGSVYQFRRNGNTWEQVQKFIPSDGAGTSVFEDRDWFGVDVAYDGGYLAVGALIGQQGLMPCIQSPCYTRRYYGAVYVESLLPRPVNVAASDGVYEDRVQVSWEDQSTAELGYTIYRGNADGGYIAVGNTPPNTEVFDDFSASSGGTYEYCVVGRIIDNTGREIESARECDIGWLPPNGVISGRIVAQAGQPVEEVGVCLTPNPNQGILFDGDGGHLYEPELVLGANNLDAFTIEFWVNSDALTLGYPLSYALEDNVDALALSDAGEGLVLTVNGATQASSITVNDGTWHHVAVSWASETGALTFYVDGTVAETATAFTGATIASGGYLVFGQDQDTVGGGFSPEEALYGRLDDVRIWNRVRTAEEITSVWTRRLEGNEPGLVGYWAFDEGSRLVTADLTGMGNNARFGAGAYWTDGSVPTCDLTSAQGNYTITGIPYDNQSTFVVTPAFPFDPVTLTPLNQAGSQEEDIPGPHTFLPGEQEMTISTESPVQNDVFFADNTTYAVAGIVQFEGTTCPVPDINVYLDDNVQAKTEPDGTYALSVFPSLQPTDLYTVAMGFQNPEDGADQFTFQPGEVVTLVEDNLLAVDFVVTTKRTLSGFVGGSCNTDIGTLTLKIFTENGCFEREVTVTDGTFDEELPPQKYLVQVVDVQDAPPGLEADILTFFDNLGAVPVDLTLGDETLDFIYRAPIAVTLSGLPDPPSACPVFTTDNGTETPAVPVLKQFETTAAMTISVVEDYGNGTTCPVDAGTVTVFDSISDQGASPVELAIVDGNAVYAEDVTNGDGEVVIAAGSNYTVFAGKPDLLQGRIIDGVNRSFQKPFTVIADVAGRDAVTETQWALIEGTRERTGSFVSATTGEMPMLVLHDPPGSNSYAYIEEGTTSCRTFSDITLTSGGAGAEVDFVIGLTIESGVAFGAYFTAVDAGGGLAFRSRLVGGRTKGRVNDGFEVCATTTKRYATPGDPTWVGEDLYMGVALNLIFAEADNLALDECTVELSETIAGGLDPEKAFETTYVYGGSHIENSLLPDLENLAELAGEDDLLVDGDLTIDGDAERRQATIQQAIDNWQRILETNQQNIAAGLEDAENRSFSAGADFEYSTSYDSTWVVPDLSGSEGTYLNFESGVGAVLTAFYDQTFLAVGETSFEQTRDSTTTRGENTTMGYVLSDGDTGDFFSVDVGTDPAYGTPVFGVRSGRSSNPWEPWPDASGKPTTQQRDRPQLEIFPPELRDIPDGEAGIFNLSLSNDSESQERREYILHIVKQNNPGSLFLSITGDPIDGETYLIDAGQTQEVTLQVERGPVRYTYENVAMYAYPEKEYEIWQADPRQPFPLADTVFFNVSFKPPCTEVNLLRPLENWALNSTTIGDSLQVILDGFDLMPSEEDPVATLGLQYRLVGTSTWLPAVNVAASTLDEDASSWSARWLPPQQGEYEVRGYSECEIAGPGDRVFSDSQPGQVDTVAPARLGAPQPSDQVLHLGDEITIDFTEPLDCSSVMTQGQGQNIELAFADGPDAGLIIDGTTATCSGNQLVLEPPETFDWDAAETLTLEARLLKGVLVDDTPSEITDAAGNAIAEAYTWSFFVARTGIDPDQLTVPLSRGWTWISTNRMVADSTLNAFLAGAALDGGDLIKSQTQFSLFDAGAGWVGPLASVEPEQSYQVKLSRPATLRVSGMPVEATTPIPVAAGWNWVGYLPQGPLPVNDALASLDATVTDGDQVKSQRAFAQYDEPSDTWVGSLTAMQPGEGYQLFLDQAGTLTYPATNAPATVVAIANEAATASGSTGSVRLFEDVADEPGTRHVDERLLPTAKEVPTEPDVLALVVPDSLLSERVPELAVRAGDFASSMSLVAELTLDEAPLADARTLVWATDADGVVRGWGRVRYVESAGVHRAFLLLHGDEADTAAGDTLRLSVYDPASEQVYQSQQPTVFAAGERLGTLVEPLEVAAFTEAYLEAQAAEVPEDYALSPNYPNPFNPITTIQYALPEAGHVRLVVYDVLGREVMRLIDGNQSAGHHRVQVDASRLASGMYLYRMEAGAFSQVRQMILVK